MQKNDLTNEPNLIENQDFSTMLGENSFIQWISNNSKMLMYSFLGLLAAIILLYRFVFSQSTQSEGDYFNAANRFAQFQKLVEQQDIVAAEEALSQLTPIIQRHPELHAQYDGLIAQLLLSTNVKEAKKFAVPTLARVSQDQLPYYIEFANTTLTIEEKKYADALQQALQLKQKMLEVAQADNQPLEFGDSLFAFNLLRIGMLQQQLDQKDAELATWQEWNYYLQSEDTLLANAFQQLNQQLVEGKTPLIDYINYRQQVIKN